MTDAVTEKSDHPQVTGHSGRTSRSRNRVDPRTWSDVVLPLSVEPADAGSWRPEIVDSGFGTGESVLALACERPGARILAVETYQAGVLRLARTLAGSAQTNVRLCADDIRAVLPHLAGASLQEFRCFFPDPWPKRRHAARRLLDADFLTSVVGRLRPDGILWFATDIAAYAEQVERLAEARPDLVRLDDPPTRRPATKYEAIAELAGRVCRDYVWRRAAPDS